MEQHDKLWFIVPVFVNSDGIHFAYGIMRSYLIYGVLDYISTYDFGSRNGVKVEFDYDFE